MNSHTRILTTHGLTLIAFLLACLPASAQEPQETPAERLAKLIKADAESIKSIEVRERLDDPLSKSDPDNLSIADHMIHHSIETDDGSRYSEWLGIRQDAVTHRSVDFRAKKGEFLHVQYDKLEPEMPKVVFKRNQFGLEFMSNLKDVPASLRFRYVSLTPLHKALPDGTPLGQCEVLGRTCQQFLFPKVAISQYRIEDQVFSIDLETGLTLKFEGYETPEDRTAGKPRTTWTAETIETIDGHPVVTRSKMISPATDNLPEMRWRFQTESITFNKDIPEAQFLPIILPKTIVMDANGNILSGPPPIRAP